MAIQISGRGRGNHADVATEVPDIEPVVTPTPPPVPGPRGRGNAADIAPAPESVAIQEPVAAPRPSFTREDMNRNIQLIGAGRLGEVQMPDFSAPSYPLTDDKLRAEADLLTLEFPSQSGRIEEMRASGKNSSDIRRYMTEQEYLAIFVDGEKPDDVDAYLGRTPETRRAMYDRTKLDQENAYYQVLKGSMARDQVRELLQVAEISGVSPSVLHQYPELYRSAKELAGRRAKTVEYLGNSLSRMMSNLYIGNRQAKLYDAMINYNAPETFKKKGGMVEWGEAEGWTHMTEEKKQSIKDYAMRSVIPIEADVRRMMEREQSRERLRPPDSALGALLLSAAESSGFSLQSGVVSGVGRTVGGVLGAITSGPAGAAGGWVAGGVAANLYNTNLESRMEGGAIFMEALQTAIASGADWETSMERAFVDYREIAQEIRRENLLLLGMTNTVGDVLTFGMGSTFTRLATKVGGKSLSSKALRGAIRQGLPFIGGAIPEGIEEMAQEYIQQVARGEPVDDRIAMEAFKFGMLNSMVYSGVGRLIAGVGVKMRQRGGRVDARIENAQRLTEQMAAGEISPDDVVANENAVFVDVATMDKALSDMGDEASRLRENLGLDAQREDMEIGEYVIPRNEYDALVRNNPELVEAIKEEVREGTHGVTAREEVLRAAKWIEESADSPLNADTAEAGKARTYSSEFATGLVREGVNEDVARGAGAIYGHSLLSQSKNYNMDVDTLHRARVIAAGSRVAGERLNQGGEWRDAWQRLNEDEAAFGKSVDDFLAENLKASEMVDVMSTPMVLNLAGAEVLPIATRYNVLRKILINKHQLSPETLKQVPRALARPAMILRSDTQQGSLVSVIGLTDADGNRVIVPIRLSKQKDASGYLINEMTSAYGKNSESWFASQVKKGNLLYIDTEKAADLLHQLGLQLPTGTTIEQLTNNIPTEADLVNLLNRNPGFYQGDESSPKGSITFDRKTGEALIEIFKNANASTAFHELWHLGLDNLLTMGTMSKASEVARADMQKALEWLGIADLDLRYGPSSLGESDAARYKAAQEKWARGGEKYLETGKAPVAYLQGLFDRIKMWLTDVIDGSAKDMDVPPAIAEVYGRLLASPLQTSQEWDSNTTVGQLLDQSRQTNEALTGDNETFNQDKNFTERDVKEKVGEAVRAERDRVTAHYRELQDNKEKLDRKKQDIRIMLREILSAVKSKAVYAATRNEISEMLRNYSLDANRRVTRDMLTENQVNARAQKRSERLAEQADRIIDMIEQDPDFAYEVYGIEGMDRAEILDYLDRMTLDQMTLSELANLYRTVTAKADEGKAILRSIQAENMERRQMMKDELVDNLHKVKPTSKKEGIVGGREDTGKVYGKFGEGTKAKDWIYAATLGAQRLFDWLDNGHGAFDGPFVRFFVDRANEARDAELAHSFERKSKVEAVMTELGIKYADLSKVREVEGITRVGGGEVTVDVLMAVYAGIKNRSSREALIYGSFQHYENPEAAIAKCVDALSDAEKKLADAIVGDYTENRDRINDVLMRVFNVSMEMEENYTPIFHLEHSGTTLAAEPTANKATGGLGGSITSGYSRGVERGFATSRVQISPEKQSGIRLGLVSVWSDQVAVQEHTAAFAGLINDLRAVMRYSPTAEEIREGLATKGESLRNLVRERFGEGAWDAMEEYFKVLVQNDSVIAQSVLNNTASRIGRNMSVVYLCANLGTILKQTTSLGRTMFLAGPSETLSSLMELMTRSTEFLEEVYSLDPQMRDRKGDPFIRAMRESKDWGNTPIQKGLDRGLELVSMMDRWIAAVVWKSMYKKQLRQGASIQKAIQEAQRTVALTQQTVHAKDAPRVWRQGGLARLAMIFTSEAAQMWGMGAYDFVQMVTSKDANLVKKGMATIFGFALSAMMMRLITNGPPDRDDDETWLQWTALAFTEESINSIPVVGKEVMSAIDELTGNNMFGPQYSALVAPLSKIVKGIKQISDDNTDNDERALWALAEGLSIYLKPFPVTAARRIFDAVRMGHEGEVIDALLRLSGQRRDINRLRRRTTILF